jgi:phage terminase large subunit-like protein
MIPKTMLARWRANPIGFIQQVLINPETNRPFVLLDAEHVFLTYAFRTGAEGRLLYPEQIFACPKKSGKTTFAAIYVITLVLLYGGVHPEAICVANDYDQSVGRVFAAIRRIVECSPQLRDEAKITADKITIFGAVIIAIPANYASAAGSNHVIAVFDELWAYVSERSRRLFDELVPPPTRRIACRLTVTYAGFEGESALLEELYRRGLQQPQVALNLYAGDGMLMFWSHEPVAPWQTDESLAEMRRSLRPNQFSRMIENRFVTSASSFIDMAAWDRCVDPGLGHAVNNPGLPIWVGVDASFKHDSTAIVATTWEKKAQRVRLVTHRVFQPSPEEPLDFEATIEWTLLDLRKRFLLCKVLYDPYQMQATAQRLTRAGVQLEEFPQSPANLTTISQSLFELIRSQNLLAYPDPDIRLAISRAVASETPRGWRIAKQTQSHKIDVVVALAMAAHAAVRGQSEGYYNTNYSAWVGDNVDWQGLRTNLYVRSGGTFRLF